MADRSLPEFYSETWSLYSLAILFTVLRVVARVKSVGIRGLKADDFIVCLAVLPYTGLTVIAYRGGTLYYGGDRRPPTVGSSGIPRPGEPGHNIWLTGQKFHIALWNTYGATLWLLKLSLLILYMRLTTGLYGNFKIRIRIGFAFLGMTWFAFLMTLYLGCRPFNRYFTSYPLPPNHCQPAVSKPIIWVCYAGNVLTDLYLISIPLPMLWSANLPRWKRSGLGLLFSGGIVIMVFATVRAVLITTEPKQGAPLSGTWAIREVFVAIITTNTPMAFTIIRKMFGPLLKSRAETEPKSKASNATPLETFGSSGSKFNKRTGGTVAHMMFSESEERIVMGMDSPTLEAQQAELEREDNEDREAKEDLERGVKL